ncbi:hypothetical protein E1200_22225 [Actinomadura sp. GC306]|uniref:hypothetical protein n=1 Tax=Actinomadura sp. GC306 TaxID=2530367 RepID=UPI00104C15A2|nr:hypothetical protein [Actinomadura sp. GC306]TDC63462.1 hypothetical protein E1200_22225 [Actinomadura sp. GC306]
MNVQQRPPPGALGMAHAMLWMQAVLCGLAWLLPNAGVLLWVAVQGIPDDGTAPYLLVPVLFSLPALLFAVPGLVIAARLPSGGRNVHTAAVVYEALWVVLGTAAFVGPFRFPLGGPPPVMSVIFASVLAAAYVLVVLLTPNGRARFR